MTADDGSFDSDPGKDAAAVAHKKGDGWSFQFKTAGTYTYHCKVHSFMTGTVRVAKLPDNLKPTPAKRPTLTNVSAQRSGRRLNLKLKAGRYMLALVAIDSSTGLAYKTVKRSFSLT